MEHLKDSKFQFLPYNEAMPIDYEELKKELAKMKPRQQLYELVKAEMTKRDRWKQHKRGVGFKKGNDPRRLDLKPKK